MARQRLLAGLLRRAAAPVCARWLPRRPPQQQAVAAEVRGASSTVLPALAAGAVCVVGLALTDGPVRAKEAVKEFRQEVYVWGRAQAVPGGSKSDLAYPVRMTWFEQNPHGWEKIVFGPSFGAALDKKGKVYVWADFSSGGKSAFVGPIAVDFQGDAKKSSFSDVQCSSNKIFALTPKGQAFVVEGLLESLQKHLEADAKSAVKLVGMAVPGLPKPGLMRSGVKQMSIGMEHACFVTTTGQLLCVGGSEWGQCGVDPPRQKGPMGAIEDRERCEVMLPTPVEMPEDAGRMESVVVGGRHTVVQAKDGRLYAFGDDRRIQLGLGDTRSQGVDNRHAFGVLHREHLGGVKPNAEIKKQVAYRYYDPHMQSVPLETIPPQAHNRPAYPPASILTCGEDFTIAVHRDSPDWYEAEKETNLIFCCGENSEGQCGRSLQQQQQVWAPARLPKHSRAEAVSCGQGHCMALMASGDLYAWGANAEGQLGINGRAHTVKPTRLAPRVAAEAAQRSLQEPMPVQKATEQPWTQSQLIRQAHLPARQRAEDCPAFVTQTPEGRVTSIWCGFRNSAVIVEVPV
eukprot:TRINITY_DN91258_c0_g1_i1.p1 TRINITY_DN91258_c0_g1~~TRINITY_DN91258_c0_g1_i1.p1  ORF type:complete len:571 (-),score=123.14 TRINITY_DN91258_c0_g1_i1:68-1780(-)